MYQINVSIRYAYFGKLSEQKLQGFPLNNFHALKPATMASEMNNPPSMGAPPPGDTMGFPVYDKYSRVRFRKLPHRPNHCWIRGITHSQLFR